MAISYLILGQSAPAATTNTDLYTVGAGKQAVCSTLSVANRGASTVKFRVAIRKNGATLANQHYVIYETEIAAGAHYGVTEGWSLAAGDIVTVYATTADLSFSLFGSEVTV